MAAAPAGATASTPLPMRPATASTGTSAGSTTQATANAVFNAYVENSWNGWIATVKGASRANDAPFIQYRYSPGGQSNDIMRFEQVGTSNWYRIKPFHSFTDDGNVHNDKCMAVKGSSHAEGAAVIQFTCSYDSVNNDVWLREPVGSYYQLRNLTSGLCLASKDDSVDENVALVQAGCTGDRSRIWRA